MEATDIFQEMVAALLVKYVEFRYKKNTPLGAFLKIFPHGASIPPSAIDKFVICRGTNIESVVTDVRKSSPLIERNGFVVS